MAVSIILLLLEMSVAWTGCGSGDVLNSLINSLFTSRSGTGCCLLPTLC